MFTYGFYNSLNGDRKYTADQLSAIFDGLISDGVFATIWNAFNTSPGTGLQVVVDTGKAWFNHTWNVNDSKLPLNLSPADVTLSRIDAIVLDINSDVNIRSNAIIVVTGTPAASPARPALIKDNNAEHWQYPLAYVTVPAKATSITESNITKVIGQGDCPFVTGILETIDVTQLLTTWKGDFDAWFSNLKIQLSGDVAANLQRQIDIINDTITLMGKNAAIVELTVKTSTGKPFTGMPIPNLYESPGSSVLAVTNSNGVAKGYTTAEGNINFGFSGYLDIVDVNKTINVVRGTKYTDSFTVTTRNYYAITATKNDCKFSNNVSRVDVTVVGGGGNAGNGIYVRYGTGMAMQVGGGGGGGGGVNVKTSVSFSPNVNYSAVIGAGGNGTNPSPTTFGLSGGQSSFLNVIATGGSGGYNGNASAAGGASGTPSSGAGGKGYYNDIMNGGSTNQAATVGGTGTQGYSSFTATTYYGGGGGGGTDGGSALSGGNGGGGNGGYYNNLGTAGAANTGGGGGGGGAPTSGTLVGAAGGSGIVTIRMTLKVS